MTKNLFSKFGNKIAKLLVRLVKEKLKKAQIAKSRNEK